MKRFLLFILVYVSFLSSCGTQAPKMPVMGARTVFEVDVEELSGLCLTLDGTALLSCGDQGVVKQISFDGKVSEIWSHDADMEGITIDPDTGHMYLAVEGSQKVYRLDAPDYTKHSSVIYVQEAIDENYSNGGLEGITATTGAFPIIRTTSFSSEASRRRICGYTGLMAPWCPRCPSRILPMR